MKKVIFRLISASVLGMVLLTACGAAPTSQPGRATATPTNQAGQAPAISHFSLIISVVKGTVETRDNANAAFAPVSVGQKLGEGAEIRTGDNGYVAFFRDQLTLVLLDKNSLLKVESLQGTAAVPQTTLFLENGGVAIEHHKSVLPPGATFVVRTQDANSSVLGSTLRVSYDPQTKIMTAVCLTGECNLKRGDQEVDLKAGQAVDVQGLAPLPNMPSEMTTDQANQFLAMSMGACGCQLTISDIKDAGLENVIPTPPADEGNSNSSTQSGSPTQEATAGNNTSSAASGSNQSAPESAPQGNSDSGQSGGNSNSG